jgi:hypothetical protein
MAIALTCTLSSLEAFGITMVIVVSLEQVLNFIFLGQFDAQCSELEQIIHGYFKGILTSLIGYEVTSAISSTTLVGTTSTTCSSLFVL